MTGRKVEVEIYLVAEKRGKLRMYLELITLYYSQRIWQQLIHDLEMIIR